MLAATRPTILRTLPPMAAAITLLCAPGYAETLDELYAKAKNEKSLVIYAGGPVSNYEPLARDFERRFPGLTVSIEGGFSNVLNQKIEQQFKDGRLEADMVLLQTAQDFVRWKQQGKMLAFKPDGADAVDAVAQGSRRGLHRLVCRPAVLCLQHATAQAGDGAEIGARFPQAGIPRQDDRLLSA